ncbi:type II secretion system protein [Salisediminibacterium halotolerans]|uniref:Type II secretory pathway, pseudopilin PulG n=1 Tax=Salisediminibacterium halotolerans TaxID=517425 RepID=A0A1H9TUF7_9BACI|nr:type II secretion system protein [Salisediminibacterium haloalkalitolerans]SES00855.1 Type II secretory pathway, pseudopilin PulG [Salisediminibacterium haloalkalitolerans]
MQKDSGYALLLVLAVIVIIGLLVPPLMSAVLSSAEQNERLAEEHQLERASEAGVVYVRNFSENLQEELSAERDERLDEGEEPEDIFTDLFADIEGVFTGGEMFRDKTFLPNQSFTEANNLENHVDVTDVSANSEQTAVTVSYVSRGEKEDADSVHEREDEYPFYLFAAGDDEDNGNGDLAECEELEESGTHPGVDCVLEGDFSFAGEYKFTGQSELTINGDASFEDLTIRGDNVQVTVAGSLTADNLDINAGRLDFVGEEEDFDVVNIQLRGNGEIFINGEAYNP